MDINKSEYREIFIEEVKDIKNKLEVDLINYEKEQNEELEKNVKRYLHTLKGDFLTYDMKEKSELFHSLEQRWLNETNKLSLISEILEVVENLNEETIFEPITIKKATSKTYELVVDFKNSTSASMDLEDFKEVLSMLSVLKSQEFLYVPDFNDLEPESLSIKLGFFLEIKNREEFEKNIVNYLPKKYFELKVVGEEEGVSPKKPQVDMEFKGLESVKVKTKKLDSLLGNIGELISEHSKLKFFKSELSQDRQDDLEDLIGQLQKITKRLQNDIFSIRLLPVNSMFFQFERLVRNVSRNLGKKVDFEIKGKDTEIDKSILEKLMDPISHMIRNSIDHGIETPEERKAKGKSEKGKIKISAYYEEGEVVIEVYDDGRGINTEKILQKIKDENLVEDWKILTKQEIYSCILGMGFTTCEEATEFSGRGVGMDIVRKQVQDLSGRVEIASEREKYTSIKLIMPLTISILDGLTVKVGSYRYVLPVLSVTETIQLDKETFELSHKDEYVVRRGQHYPLVRLHDIFNVEGAIEDPFKAITVIVQAAGIEFGLLIDEIMDIEQVVIKKMDLTYEETKKFIGATILGNGEIAFIMDPRKLYEYLVEHGEGGALCKMNF